MAQTPPSFIERDGSKIVAEMVEYYQTLTGRTLHPAQAERLLINAFAYRELLLREQIQATAVQMLVEFATDPALDYLASLVGVVRLAASGATATIRFSLIDGHNGVVIPANLRVGSVDGRVVFATAENVTVDVGTETADVEVFCETLGELGNGYEAGEISQILDPQPFLTAAENLATTSGGADEETDDELRERIQLAPSAFSVAGPTDAYKFHAKSASPAIIDVYVPEIPDVPGTVLIYPLVSGGIETPPEILALVAAACNNKKVRPLTDTVEVISPTVVDYDVELDVVIYTDGDSPTIQAAIEAALQTYTQTRATQLGKDVPVSQLIALATFDVNQVFQVTVVSPSADVEIDPNEVAICGSITVNITGESDG